MVNRRIRLDRFSYQLISDGFLFHRRHCRAFLLDQSEQRRHPCTCVSTIQKTPHRYPWLRSKACVIRHLQIPTNTLSLSWWRLQKSSYYSYFTHIQILQGRSFVFVVSRFQAIEYHTIGPFAVKPYFIVFPKHHRHTTPSVVEI